MGDIGGRQRDVTWHTRRMHPARLVIVCGPPGGATVPVAERLAERFAATRMAPDPWIERLGVDLGDAAVRARIVLLQAALTIDLLRVGANVVAEAGVAPRAERDLLRRRAVDVGALVHLEVVDATNHDGWQRPADDELATYDPLPPVGAGERPGTASFPYGSWLP